MKTDGGWVDAVAPEGKAIINTGMTLEVLSDGVNPAGVHRVVADPTYAAERYSVDRSAIPLAREVIRLRRGATPGADSRG